MPRVCGSWRSEDISVTWLHSIPLLFRKQVVSRGGKEQRGAYYIKSKDKYSIGVESIAVSRGMEGYLSAALRIGVTKKWGGEGVARARILANHTVPERIEPSNKQGQTLVGKLRTVGFLVSFTHTPSVVDKLKCLGYFCPKRFGIVMLPLFVVSINVFLQYLVRYSCSHV